MTPLQMITEWRKGCSCAPADHPEQCHECTAALIRAIERALANQPARMAHPTFSPTKEGIQQAVAWLCENHDDLLGTTVKIMNVERIEGYNRWQHWTEVSDELMESTDCVNFMTCNILNHMECDLQTLQSIGLGSVIRENEDGDEIVVQVFRVIWLKKVE